MSSPLIEKFHHLDRDVGWCPFPFSSTPQIDRFLKTNIMAVESKLHHFLHSHQGKTLIRRILVANNGMAAVKCIRSIRRWASTYLIQAYEELGNEREIQFTAMATPEDIKVNAEYIRMADQYVQIPGGTSNNNYSNVDLIVDIAERTGVDVFLLITE